MMTRLCFIVLLLLVLLPVCVTAADDSIVLTGDIQMRLGDAFMSEGEYYRAITEYKKYLILFPDGSQRDAALFQAGRAYYLGLEYDPAVQAFAELRSRFPDSPYAAEAAFLAGVCNARLNRPDKADDAFEEAAVRKTAPAIASEARLGRSFLDFDRGDMTGARDELQRFLADFPADQRAGKVRTALTLLPQDGELPRKSTLAAGILSAIVPGSGHVYAGHYGDGATALLLNGLFITGTVVAVRQENYAVAGVVGVIGLPFYIGNIYGAANVAAKWNLAVSKGLRDRLAVTLDYRF
jgi:tetratricopeptide (TPR) repeat protein